MFSNALTKNEYSTSNQNQLDLSAALNDFESLEVAGYKQWLEMGFQVQKGQKATAILMIVEKKVKKADGSDTKKKVPKTVKVFFRDQVAPIEILETNEG